MSIRLDTVSALDRQTDRQTELVKQYRILHNDHQRNLNLQSKVRTCLPGNK